MAIINKWESSKEYDNELSKIEHFSKGHHPEMTPFIGSHYNETGILLVGESHYIPQEPNNAKYHLDYFQKNWWDGNCLELLEEYLLGLILEA